MNRRVTVGVALVAFIALVYWGRALEVSAYGLKVISDQAVPGFAFPESVGCDVQGKVLYVSQFGSELKPTQKDGKGRISKVSLDGKVLEEQFLPAPGGVLNKPKGIWVQDNKLWVTDIDVVWEFDLQSRHGKQIALPEIQFANDPTISGKALYVSDNRGDQLYRVEPANFQDMQGEPMVTRVFSGKSVNPNGVYPARDGSLLMVGFKSAEEARGIYSLDASGEPKSLSAALGRLDGIYQLDDGSFLVTDWNTGALAQWSEKEGMETLAAGFKGPADFCVVPSGTELLVVVPDLVKSELRMIRLAE